MSDKTDMEKPELQSLVNRYQQTSAPPGFTNRVMAHIEDDKKHRLPRIPVFAYAASVGAIILVSVVIVYSTKDEQPEPQIARQETQQLTEPVQNKVPVEVASLPERPVAETKKPEPSSMVAKADKPVTTTKPASAVTISISKQEVEQFFQSETESDSTSLAVLTDISDWLADQNEVSLPDISDLPDLNDIDKLFDTT
jgi:cytoskeletal protein RodZ